MRYLCLELRKEQCPRRRPWTRRESTILFIYSWHSLHFIQYRSELQMADGLVSVRGSLHKYEFAYFQLLHSCLAFGIATFYSSLIRFGVPKPDGSGDIVVWMNATPNYLAPSYFCFMCYRFNILTSNIFYRILSCEIKSRLTPQGVLSPPLPLVELSDNSLSLSNSFLDRFVDSRAITTRGEIDATTITIYLLLVG